MNIYTKWSIVLSMFLIAHVGKAQFVGVEQAMRYAETYIDVSHNNQNFVQEKRLGNNAVSHITQDKVISIGDAEQPYMYAIPSNNQWLIISADERMTPVLFLSDTEEFNLDDITPAMQDLLDWYVEQIQIIRDHPEDYSVHPQWQGVELAQSQSASSSVSPLLKKGIYNNKWKQKGNNTTSANSNKMYNLYCPSANYDNGSPCIHAVVGCVALSVSQIMWKWEWPNAARVTENGYQYFVREYDWDKMPYQILSTTSQDKVEMIAHLLSDVGKSLNMNYDCEASTAFVTDVPATFRAFGFHTNERLERSSFNADWIAMLKSELDAGRPVIYDAHSCSNCVGHCFVIDGYNRSGLFHVNFGDGEDAGYWSLDEIYFGLYYLRTSHSAITGIYPNYFDCGSIYLAPEWGSSANYTYEYHGGINMYDAVVEPTQNVFVFSSDFVHILPGAHLMAGSNVHIGIHDIACTGEMHIASLDNSIMSAPRQNDITTDTPQLASTMSVSISPNPVHDVLTIEGCESYAPEINIYSIQGQLVSTSIGTPCDRTPQGLRTSADVSALPNGIYLLTCNDNGHITQHKFIKQ